MAPSSSAVTRTLRREGGREHLLLPRVEVALKSASGQVLRAPLGMSPVRVGSAGECDLVCADPGISRHHCEVALDERGVILRDLGSKNGTFVGDLRIEAAWLSPGLVARVGEARLEVVCGGDPQRIDLSATPRFGEALGLSTTMRALFAQLERVAPSRESVVLLGETGTGKEILARALHLASPRARGPFVAVDCGAIAASLAESELFGHVRGAFSGAQTDRTGLLVAAHAGTLFLDEIGELPLDLQPKLLRALEIGEVRAIGGNSYKKIDIRVVAASHRNLKTLLAERRFREDLYYRLAVVELRVPPLRERREDIPLLVESFLTSRDPPLTLADLPPNALEFLQARSWPGNVRELRNAVSRLLLAVDGLQAGLQAGPQARAPAECVRPGRPGLFELPLREAREQVVAEFERNYLTAQMERHRGNGAAAAKAMGVSRQLVHRLLSQHGLKGGDG
jgi:DNA-binding NtrC family response regulator